MDGEDRNIQKYSEPVISSQSSITRLPFEIWREIFLEVWHIKIEVPDTSSPDWRTIRWYPTHRSSWRVSWVWRWWRTVALETPELWTNVTIETPHSSAYAMVKEFLSRSQQNLLDLEIINYVSGKTGHSNAVVEDATMKEMMRLLAPHLACW